MSALRIVMDGRPMQGGSAARGVGTYTRGLLTGFAEAATAVQPQLLLAARGHLPPEIAALRVRAAARRVPSVQPTLQQLLDPVLVARALHDSDADLYHAVHLGQPMRARIPVVVTVHDLIPALFPRQYPWARLAMEPSLRLLPRADHVIAVSEATARDVARLAHVPRSRITVVPEGVHAAFSPAQRDDVARVLAQHSVSEPYLLAVGTFDPRKRIDLTADVVRRIRASAPVQLVIAGAQMSFASSVERALAEAGISAITRRTGHVSAGELRALYTGATALLFTSAYEGFGLPPLEAMACGAPVIMFDNSSLPEVAGDAALVARDGDAEGMAGLALRLLPDSRLRDEVSARGRHWAARFTWQRTAEETARVYRAAIETRTR